MATNWTLVGVGAAQNSITTTLTPNLPAGVQEGDLLVSIISARAAQTFTPPTDWNLVTSQGIGNTSTTTSASIASGALAWIIHGSSAPALQWTLTTANVARAQILAYRPSAGDVEFVGASSNTLGANSTTVTTGGLTTDQEDCLIVAGACGADNVLWSAFDAATDPTTASGATNTTTAPTRGTWIERADGGTNSGSDTSLGIADAVRQNAGATGTIQCTAAASSRHVMVAAAFRAVVSSSPGNAPASDIAGTGGITGGAATGQASAPASTPPGSGAASVAAATGKAEAPGSDINATAAVTAPPATGGDGSSPGNAPPADVAGAGAITAGTPTAGATVAGKSIAGTGSSATTAATGRAAAPAAATGGIGATSTPAARGKGLPASIQAAGAGGAVAEAARGRGLAAGASSTGSAVVVAPPAAGGNAGSAPGAQVEGLGEVTGLSAQGQAMAPAADVAGSGVATAPAASGKHTSPAAQAIGVGGIATEAARGRATGTGAGVAGSSQVAAPPAVGSISAPAAQVEGTGEVFHVAARGKGLAPGAETAGAATVSADPAFADEALKVIGDGIAYAPPATGRALAVGAYRKGYGRIGFGQPFDDPSGIYFRDPENGVITRFLFRHGRQHAFVGQRATPRNFYQSLLGLQRIDPWTGEEAGPPIEDADLDSIQVGEEA
jgi:hypothetical protein